jgi:hypothetical protein
MWLLALMAGVIASALYIAFPSQYYNGDALQVVMDVERNVNHTTFYHPSGSPLYEPGYLENPAPSGQAINLRYYLDYPVLTLVSKLWIALGLPSESLIPPLLLYRAVMGGVSVFFTAMFMYTLRPVRWIALVIALSLGVSASHWTYATDMYQSITLVALVAAAAYALAVQARKPNPQEPVGLIIIGGILAFATLHNILGVLAAGAFGLSILALPTAASWFIRLRAGFIYGVAFVLVAGIFYAGTSALLPATQGQTNPFQWSSEAGDSQSTFFTDFSPVEDGLRAFLGVAKSQVIFPGINVRQPQGLRDYWEANPGTARILLMAFYIVVMLLMSLPAFILFWRRKQLPAQQRWLYILLAALIVLYTLFNWYWLPSDVHYWLVPTFCLWIVMGIFLAHLLETAPRTRRWLLPVSAAFLIFIFTSNWLNQMLPEATRPNALLVEAERIRVNTSSKDMLISDGNPLDFYLVYFARRNILATTILNRQIDSNAARASEVATEQARRVMADGGTLYFYSGDEDPAVIQTLAVIAGLPADAQVEPAWEDIDHYYYRLVTDDSA